jgi:transcriptional regulator with XRE-family HTH domain
MNIEKIIVDLHDRIRLQRLQLGYSQEFIAARLNISQQAYSQIEKDPSTTSLKRLLLLAEIIQLNPKDLICFQEYRNEVPSNGHSPDASNGIQPSGRCENCIAELKQNIHMMADSINVIKRKINTN